MSQTHHNLDPWQIPREGKCLFINEPWLIDESIYIETFKEKEVAIYPEDEEDNVRVYIPLDLNRKAILRRLEYVINKYEEANEENEFKFSNEVCRLIAHIEIYDQIWSVRHMPTCPEQHSDEAKELVKEFVDLLKNIPDGCAECFPFDLIEELEEEYLK